MDPYSVPHVSHGLNSKKGIICIKGSTVGLIKGDTRIRL